MVLYATTVPSPVGALRLVTTGRGLRAVLWEDDRPGRVKLDRIEEAPAHSVLLAARQELTECFAGARTAFTVPLDGAGTDFQQRVWAALATIPFGETRSYGDIAAQIGSPAASRAVGAANGRNPISIIVPCHRVIGRDGALTGFAGGVDIKQRLLAFERGAGLATRSLPSVGTPAVATAF